MDIDLHWVIFIKWSHVYPLYFLQLFTLSYKFVHAMYNFSIKEAPVILECLFRLNPNRKSIRCPLKASFNFIK